MKSFIFSLIFACTIFYNQAQNLVTNPNFSSDQTPKGWSEINKSNSWMSATSGTPDLYSTMAKSNEVTVPANIQGNQQPVSGNNYAGIIAYQSESEMQLDGLIPTQKSVEGAYTEYIQTALKEGLKANQEYEVEIKWSLSERSSYAINNLGVYVSDIPMTGMGSVYLNVEPTALAREVIKSNDWVSSKLNFKAKGNEKYLIIGSWKKNRKVEEVNAGGNHRAYYYIGEVVLKEGKVKDSDGDGIADNIDKCPTLKGLFQFNGCPDTDSDGIVDSEDKCPNEAGVKDNGGCPAKSIGVVKGNANKDRDKDGVMDNEDQCPDVKGMKEFQGCPDSDNDGVVDKEDECPTTPGIEDNKGCPEIKAEVLAVFERALTGIQFETGKDVIKPNSYSILNDVVSIMKENPTYSLEVDGHTDNQGNAAANKKLSQSRANAVKKYLVTKGVKAGRLTAIGYGQEKPVENNDTPEGRAKNRRVEFKVK